jgi:methyl-accepting chemotaxis protein
MNFDDAIKAHAEWRLKLSVYLRKPDGSLSAQDIGVDNKCALGQWIYGEGSKWSAMPEYETLRSEHARFHMAAAAVVKKCDAGLNTGEDTVLGGNSDYSAASNNVITAIMKMKRKVG